MSAINFSKEEKDAIISKIKQYFHDELQQDIGQFDAEFLLDFFTDEIGSFFYNRGLYDAETLLNEKITEISDLVMQLEKPVSFRNS